MSIGVDALRAALMLDGHDEDSERSTSDMLREAGFDAEPVIGYLCSTAALRLELEGGALTRAGALAGVQATALIVGARAARQDLAHDWDALHVIEARSFLRKASEGPLSTGERIALGRWLDDPANHPGPNAHVKAIMTERPEPA